MSFDALASAPVRVQVPATSANLGPGFDALGLALGLWNELELSLADVDELETQGEGAGELQAPTIIHRAARAVFDEVGMETRGVRLKLWNQVPLARGLGSSSAAIVGGLVAANECARRAGFEALTTQQLLNLANQIEGHPDNVAPALLGGLVAAATSDDGQVHFARVPVRVWPRFVVWIPDAPLPTSQARGVLPATFSRADAVFNLSRAALLVGALASGELESLREALRDRIHQNQRAALVPGWTSFVDEAESAGALGATLSGAGPSILVWLAPDAPAQSVRERLESVAREEQIGGRALVVEPSSSGAHVVDS